MELYHFLHSFFSLVVVCPHLNKLSRERRVVIFYFLMVLGTGPKTSCMPGKQATAELHPGLHSHFLVTKHSPKFSRLSPPVRICDPPAPASRDPKTAGLRPRVGKECTGYKSCLYGNTDKSLLTSAPWAPRPAKLTVQTCAAGVGAGSGPRQLGQRRTAAAAVHEDQLHT